MRAKTIRDVPDDLWRSLKARAAMRGLPIREIVIEALHQWLAADIRREEGQIHVALNNYGRKDGR